MGGRGFLTFEFYSGEGKNLKGCVPNLALRIALTLITGPDIPLKYAYQYFPQLQGKGRAEVDVFLWSLIQENLQDNNLTFTYETTIPWGPAEK